jgi:hypothetical protein
MNILQISVHDHGGCGYYLAEAINQVYKGKHKSKLLRQTGGSWIGYKAHLMGDGAALVGPWQWADVIHIHDGCPKLPVGLNPKPTVVTFHGTMYRKAHEKCNATIKKKNWIGTVSTIDLTSFGLRWMPDCRQDFSSYVDRDTERFIAVHAPTSRAVKGTDQIIKELRDIAIPNFELDIIEMTPYEKCLERKGRGSLLIDQFKLCYGLNAIEAWTMSIPVIANAEKKTLARIKEEVGFIPFVQSRLGTGDLVEKVQRLYNDSQFYSDAVERGRICVENHHLPRAAARRAMDYYEEALSVQGVKMPEVADAQTEKFVSGDVIWLRYVGGNSGKQKFWGEETRMQYEFSGSKREGPVAVEDAPAFLRPRKFTRGRTKPPEFEVM